MTFDLPVVVAGATAPTLRIETTGGANTWSATAGGDAAAAVDAVAPLVAGNGTAALTFRYVVRPGDRSRAGGLDYVDTREAPYSARSSHASLALLVSDHVSGNTSLLSSASLQVVQVVHHYYE